MKYADAAEPENMGLFYWSLIIVNRNQLYLLLLFSIIYNEKTLGAMIFV